MVTIRSPEFFKIVTSRLFQENAWSNILPLPLSLVFITIFGGWFSVFGLISMGFVIFSIPQVSFVKFNTFFPC